MGFGGRERDARARGPHQRRLCGGVQQSVRRQGTNTLPNTLTTIPSPIHFIFFFKKFYKCALPHSRSLLVSHSALSNLCRRALYCSNSPRVNISLQVATGSFDKTCKLWDVATGSCFHTFKGHTAEIVCLAFNPQSTLLASGSMDRAAKIWEIESGKELGTLEGHTSEIICVSFNQTGDRYEPLSHRHLVKSRSLTHGWRHSTGPS